MTSYYSINNNHRRDNKEQGDFLGNVRYECLRTLTQVSVSRWKVTFSPLQALNLRYQRNLFVRVKYGNSVSRTRTCPPTAQPKWKENNNLNDEYIDLSNHNHNINRMNKVKDIHDEYDSEFDSTFTFIIDANNIYNYFCIDIISESFHKNEKIASIKIPVFNLIDYMHGTSTRVVDRWIPLIFSKHLDPVLKDPRLNDYPSTADWGSLNGDIGVPCIRMRIGFQKENTRNTTHDQTILYSRINIPSLTFSIVDSSRARELMIISVNDTNIRCVMSLSETNLTGSLGWIQIDNQLPGVLAPVLISPTLIKMSQPTFRFTICRDNTESQEFDCFRSVENGWSYQEGIRGIDKDSQSKYIFFKVFR